MLKAIRLGLICVVLVAMGGIGYTQVDWSTVNFGGGDRAQKTSLIKSTSTSSRSGRDKTIRIEQKSPGLILSIRMFFGYNPEDAHTADLKRLQRKNASEAARRGNVNSVTGRKESTASRRKPELSRSKAGANRTLKSALGG